MRAILMTAVLITLGAAFPAPVEASDCDEALSQCYIREITTK